MTRYIAGRLVGLLAVLVGVTALTFGLGTLAPGDPAELSITRLQEAPPTIEQLEAKHRELRLDRPLVAQYTHWVGQALRGDLGRSWVNGESVSAAMGERLPRTILLAGTALALGIGIALPLGVLSAYRKDTAADHLGRFVSLLGTSMPGHFLAYVLILILGGKLQLLPVLGFDSLSNLALPALMLGLGSAAGLTRFTRAAVLEVLDDSHFLAARARGVGTRALLTRHALRNASLPMVTVIALALGGLLGGAFVVESIFVWPGLGTLAVNAIREKDVPMVQGFVLFATAAHVVVNFAADLSYAWLDPRVRLRRETA